jgi:hypothetical protein
VIRLVQELGQPGTDVFCETDPKTGEKSLQVHGQGAFKLYLKDSPDGNERIVDDLEEVRAFMDK